MLLSPWDFPGMNAVVSCHALLQGIFPTLECNPHFFFLLHWQLGSLSLVPPGKLPGEVLVAQLCSTLCNPWIVAHQDPQSTEFSRQEYWSGSHSLLQRIFSTQGSNPGLPYCRWILYHLNHQGSPKKHRLNQIQLFSNSKYSTSHSL